MTKKAEEIKNRLSNISEAIGNIALEYITELENENADLEAQLESERDLPAIAYMQGTEKQKKKDAEQLAKAKEILQTVLDKWKEERWILQSEKEVRMIERLMKQAEQFLSDSKQEGQYATMGGACSQQ